MNHPRTGFFSLIASSVVASVLVAPSSVVAQQSANIVAVNPVAVSSAKSGAVPSLVSYSGILKDAAGKAITGVTGVTFLLYKDSEGGAPLWMETQSVTPDKLGRYAVQLGSTTSAGLPSEVFMTGEARWLGVQLAGEAEQPRVLLVAVPYAMKAGDAATIGGLPPSAFVLAAPVNGVNDAASAPAATSTSNSTPPPPASNVTTTGGTVNTIPLFTTATNVQNSILTQTAATAVNVGGKLNHPATGTATKTAGKNSQPDNFVASAFNSGTSTAVPQTFQLQAEPAGNNTATASGTLNVLYASGTATPAETGLKIGHTGLITFATGQTFPGAGTITGITTAAGSGLAGGGTTGTLSLKLLSTCAANQILKWSGTAWACAADANSGGTVKSVALAAPSSDFVVTGSPVTTTGTLNLAWNIAPTSANTANAIVKRDASGEIMIGALFATGVSASNASPSATTIYGGATSATGAAWGVEGDTSSSASDAFGVFGHAGSGSGNPIGVYGQAASTLGIGMFGQNGTFSGTGSAASSAGYAGGVWGDGGQTVGEAGVIATVDEGTSGDFYSNGSSHYGVWIQNLSTAPSWIAGYGPSLGGLTAYCYVDNGGNINCTGAKNAVVPVDGGKRTVAMSAIEAPQNWFEDAGSAQLVNGAAVVRFDPDFIQTVNTEMDYKVFPVPNGDCKGLYVTNKTATSFEVRELGGGTSSVAFDYRIMALRRKYENVRFADHTRDMEPMKLMQERARAAAARPRPQQGPVKKPGLAQMSAAPRVQSVR